jgi:hypothetical protein
VASTSADADRADPESDETPAAAKASDASSAG